MKYQCHYMWTNPELSSLASGKRCLHNIERSRKCFWTLIQKYWRNVAHVVFRISFPFWLVFITCLHVQYCRVYFSYSFHCDSYSSRIVLLRHKVFNVSVYWYIYYFFSEPPNRHSRHVSSQSLVHWNSCHSQGGLVLDFQKDVCLVSSPDLDPTPDPHHSFLILVALFLRSGKH